MTENYTHTLRRNHILCLKETWNFTSFGVGNVTDDIVEVNLSQDVMFNARQYKIIWAFLRHRCSQPVFDKFPFAK